MDAGAFRAARRELGLTVIEFAQAFGVSRRTVLNWSAKGPPGYIAELLQLALSNKVPAPSRPIRPADDNMALIEEATIKLTPALDGLLKTASSAGWPRDIVVAGVRRWLDER